MSHLKVLVLRASDLPSDHELCHDGVSTLVAESDLVIRLDIDPDTGEAQGRCIKRRMGDPTEVKVVTP